MKLYLKVLLTSFTFFGHTTGVKPSQMFYNYYYLVCLYFALVFCVLLFACTSHLMLYTAPHNEYMSTSVSTICIYSSVMSLCTYYNVRMLYSWDTLSWSQINLILSYLVAAASQREHLGDVQQADAVLDGDDAFEELAAQLHCLRHLKVCRRQQHLTTRIRIRFIRYPSSGSTNNMLLYSFGT